MSLPLHRPFKSVLIANRGEIAVRIVREAQAAGLRAIAVFSDIDRHAPHVTNADAAVAIGSAPARESYLVGAKILAAAHVAKADAVHPGYGFLAENADFAQAVIDAGLIWIGPLPQAIQAMGDKGVAKRLARDLGLPVIPGYDGEDQADDRLLAEARTVGWPVLIKAANGGGGRGQRRVANESDFAASLASARREAMSAFASDRIILERALEDVRHIEVQVFGDAHGHTIHLGERDCSVQRRNQKLIEEAPAPHLSDELRTRMGSAAAEFAHAFNYIGAGTVEFLLDGKGRFYFLEMNTRIQVEHPVTEEVTGLNLIRLQFDVAMGNTLPLAQDEVRVTGHAIEARLCAEDPADGFKPQTGRVTGLLSDGATRFDTGIVRGTSVTVDYDSMLGKVIAHGKAREEARANLVHALRRLAVFGVTTNKQFLLELLADDKFRQGLATTNWLESRATGSAAFDEKLGQVAALMAARGNGDAWSSTGARRTIVNLAARGTTRAFAVDNGLLDGVGIEESFVEDGVEYLTLSDAGTLVEATAIHTGVRLDIDSGDRTATFDDVTYAPAEPKHAAGDGAMRAPMAGKIVRVNAAPGSQVEKGQVLIILEAMKMEHEIVARSAGTVAAVNVKTGDQVAARQVLATIAAP